MSDADANWECVLALDSDSPEFVRGIEIGRLVERLRLRAPVRDELVHATNAEMLARISETLGVRLYAVPVSQASIDMATMVAVAGRERPAEWLAVTILEDDS
jgi:hypothetical protein